MLGKKRQSSQPEVAPSSGATFSSSSNVSEQIARLQQRQLEMVQQTAQELESLKVQLENSDQVEKLQAEVRHLQDERSQLEKSMHELQHQFLTQQTQATETIAGLTDVIRAHLKHVQGFAHDTEAYLDRLPSLVSHTPPPAPVPQVRKEVPLPVVEKPAPIPVVATPAPAPTVVPVVQQTLPQELPLKATKKPVKARTFSGRTFARRAVAIALVGLIGYAGLHFVKGQGANSSESGQVAGAATVAQIDPSQDPYAESYAEVPFADTTWEQATDTDFGISFTWPKNATNKVRTLGGNNLWILRHNGYLMKITLIESGDTLEAWYAANQKDYADGTLKGVKTTFKGLPAYYVESSEKTVTSGSSYFVKRQQGIFQIWLKDEPATTDDGQRLTKMVSSLTFTN